VLGIEVQVREATRVLGRGAATATASLTTSANASAAAAQRAAVTADAIKCFVASAFPWVGMTCLPGDEAGSINRPLWLNEALANKAVGLACVVDAGA